MKRRLKNAINIEKLQYNICNNKACGKPMEFGDECLVMLATEITAGKFPYMPIEYECSSGQIIETADEDDVDDRIYPFRPFCCAACLLEYLAAPILEEAEEKEISSDN